MKSKCECCGQSLLREGLKIKSNITDFNITKGKIYEIKGISDFPNCIFIIDDRGVIREYGIDYFSVA